MERSKGLVGKVREFINPTPIEDKYKELLRRVHEEILKPLGFKKDGQNFRQFTPDGLGKIVNFWRDGKYGIKDKCLRFAIDIGIYFEAEPSVSNRKFKKYDCQFRNVAHNPKPVTVYVYPDPQFWYIFKRTDMDSIFESLNQALQESFDWFAHFESRQSTIDMILDGTAQQYSITNVMNYHTAEMLAEMGYQAQVYEQIKGPEHYPYALYHLAQELREQLGLKEEIFE